nr:hypothetical protein [Tanacetum cinerariifolium]
ANEIKGGCQVGLRAKSHGVLGIVEWYCSGRVRVYGMVCGEDGVDAGVRERSYGGYGKKARNAIAG